MEKDQHLIFTDGSSLGNPGKGGFGAILALSPGRVIELGGRVMHTTNNRMELTALIEALRRMEEETGDVTIYLDSAYVEQGARKWIHGWKKRGWMTTQKTDVENRDLWETLDELLSSRAKMGKISWKHIPGHAGVTGNERCDEIATGFAGGEEVELFEGNLSDYAVDILNISIDEEAEEKKRIAKSRSREKAYSYLSLVGGKAKRHLSWADCEKRVKGKSGAKYKKALSPSDESAILRSWGARL